ncbi:MAG: hypothetical protein WC365_00120 [Candidatus Babeliales bacterium]|jgi:hypothetical protein
MTRKSFLLMLVASAVGAWGLYAATTKKLRIPNVGVHKVSDLYKIIRTNDSRADFILAAKDIATNTQKKMGIHIYEPMTTHECKNKPELIAGSVSPNRFVGEKDPLKPVYTHIKNLLTDNKSANVQLTSNPNLLNVLKRTRFLTETKANTKLIQKVVSHKSVMGKSMTRDQLIAAYGRALLSFDLGGYSFFLVDPFPPAARATSKVAVYPIVTAVLSKWQF